MPTSDALQEYFKLLEIVRGFDGTPITIKGWGVTLSLAAIGLGFKEKIWGYFLLAALSGLAFWGIEPRSRGRSKFICDMIAREVADESAPTMSGPAACPSMTPRCGGSASSGRPALPAWPADGRESTAARHRSSADASRCRSDASFSTPDIMSSISEA